MKLAFLVAAVAMAIVSCASCQKTSSAPTPSPWASDSGAVVMGDGPVPQAPASAICIAACVKMSALGCSLGARSTCASSLTTSDAIPGALTDDAGHSVTCACIADAGSFEAVQRCGIVCPP